MGDSNKTRTHKFPPDIPDENDQYYSELIKRLPLDTSKLEINLKKYTKKDELIILIESGALAPPHRMHIGLMEKVKKYFEENGKNKKVIGGYIIPSSDNYIRHKLKQDFIPLKHRVNITKILIKNSDWLECLDWNMAYGEEIKICIDKILKQKFPNVNIKSYLVFGIDFYIRTKIQLKSEQVCIYRPGYDLNEAKKIYTKDLFFVEGNDEDISSTKIRKALRNNDEKTINELMSKDVVEYIKNNNIFEYNN
jgi:nicotinic acid mononucleotide adenylyltransferase